MKIFFNIAFSLLFVFANMNLAFGQRVYPLKETDKKTRQGIYLNVKIVDSLDYIKIFLVNRSEKKYRYYCFLDIKTEAKNKAGQWLNIDPVYLHSMGGV